MKLNQQQQDAVVTIEGAVLVLAGAGTGKTRTVTERIAYLLHERKVPPRNIMAVTFTNKAAQEMRERIRQRVGRLPGIGDMIISTFHSLCMRILRADGTALGYRPNFSISDQGEQLSIIRRCMRDIRNIPKMKPEDIQSEISRAKTNGYSPFEYARMVFEERENAIARIYQKYQENLRAMNAMDFDDLMINALRLFKEHPQQIKHWQDRARYLMVDEFQDTNRAQLELLKHLAAHHGNICVVGDDDQSIYSWRGAQPKNIVEFDRHFKGAKSIRLEENYRSTNTILKAANALISNNEVRVQKSLWSHLGEGNPISLFTAEDSGDEAERVVHKIQNLVENGTKPKDHAILVRTNAQTRPFEDELRARNIPYVVIGGQSFFDRKEVRDVLAYLSVIANPDDDTALIRIINTPARGIGTGTLEKLGTLAATEKVPLISMLRNIDNVGGVPAAAVRGAKGLTAFFDRFTQRAQGKNWNGLVRDMLEDLHYGDEINHAYDDALVRAARYNNAIDVDESLKTYLERDDGHDLSSFLQDTMLTGREQESGKSDKIEQDAVRIITLHSAKGLEFPYVYLAGMQEGLLPHKNSTEHDDIAEERRLAYVGITRAQRQLTLSHAKRRSDRGKYIDIKPSRFLKELPAELLDNMSRMADKADILTRLKAMTAQLGETS